LYFLTKVKHAYQVDTTKDEFIDHLKK